MERLLYIDRLKGLAMLLVVMGHTIYFCMYHEQSFSDPLFSLICTFHVPLFFFLSGFVITKAPHLKKFFHKAYKFLTPMLLVGVVNALLIGKVKDFFMSSGHNGYWYLLTLTVFYLLLIPFQLTENRRRLSILAIDTMIALSVWLMLFLILRADDNSMVSAFNPGGAFSFWPYFILGYLCRKYDVMAYLINKNWLTILTALAYLVLVITSFSHIGSLPLYLAFIIAMLAITTLFLIFHAFNNSPSFINRQLEFIGINTLNIYLYHYFFIRFINLDFLVHQPLIIELLFTISLTIIIAYAATFIGKGIDRIISCARHRFSLLLVILMSLALQAHADSYDPNNYPPTISDTKLTETNLPIVFIDTRCGEASTQAIHKDYRIAVRMKIINNPDGINYGDTLTHPSQTIDYEGWVAIRYRGNTSFTWSPKKPYNFKTMKTSDPNGDKQKTNLLGMPEDNTWVLLAPYDDCSMLRDALMFQLARPWFEYTPRYHYCELILDGIYYGIYILGENIRKSKYRLNLDDPGTSGDALTGGYILQIDRNDEPYFTSKYLAVDSLGRTYHAYNQIYFQYKHPDYEDLLPEQEEYIQQRIEQMEDALASSNFADTETGYCQYLDALSFIDQQLSQEFSGNIDGYRLSTNIYKKRDSIDPRFKTVIWDFDLAFGNSNSANAIGTDFWRYQNSYLTDYNAYNKVPFWWMRLMEDPSYVKQLKERWTKYRFTNYSDEHIIATIDSITNYLNEKGAIERNNTTWKMFNSTTYEMEIERLKQWILKRVAWMDEQLDYSTIISGIDNSTDDFRKTIIGYYNIKGMRLSQPPSKGIYIVRFKDGTSTVIAPTIRR